MAVRITQGATRAIVIDDIVDATGAPLTVTGWQVRAQARQSPESATILAEWSTTPTGVQGQASASGRTVRLEVPHAMSSGWTWTSAVLHAEITDPNTDRRERILDVPLVVDREGVR